MPPMPCFVWHLDAGELDPDKVTGDYRRETIIIASIVVACVSIKSIADEKPD
jgi:hypothetical protein